MNILYHFRTQGTGAEGVHIAGVSQAFEQMGHRVLFSSPTGVDPRHTAGGNPFSRKKRSLLARLAAHAPGLLFELLELGYNLAAFLRNRRILEQNDCGLIYERHAFFLFSTALLARARGLPLVVEVNELAGDERVRAKPWLTFVAHWADRTTFRNAKLIVVVSPHLKRRICAMGVPEERILVLPNAVAAESLERPSNGAAIRTRFAVGNSTVLGFVGWFVPWHRLDVLVQEFATLVREGRDVRLMLVGDGPLKTELGETAARLGIADRVIFTGPAPHAEIPDFVAAMDVCVVPHSNEYRSPIKLFEYMAQARAVAAPRTEPVAAVIRHGENGMLFNPEQPEDLRTQLAALVDSPQRRAVIGARALEDIRARYTWEQNVQAVLEGIAGRGRGL